MLLAIGATRNDTMVHSACQKNVQEASTDANLDYAFLGTISSTKEPSWKQNVSLEGQETLFKLTQEQKSQQLQKSPSGRVLYGPAHQTLEVMGQLDGTFSHKGKEAVRMW